VLGARKVGQSEKTLGPLEAHISRAELTRLEAAVPAAVITGPGMRNTRWRCSTAKDGMR
jgi:hypothetical protein